MDITILSVSSSLDEDDDDDESVSYCPTFFEESICSGDDSTADSPTSIPVAPREEEPGSCREADEPLLEIAPGIRLQLRRSKETLEAIRNDFCTITLCFGCGFDLFCIADAEYCVCPSCKTVSPLDSATNDDQGKHHGVGIGFTASTMIQVQSDILAGRR